MFISGKKVRTHGFKLLGFKGFASLIVASGEDEVDRGRAVAGEEISELFGND